MPEAQGQVVQGGAPTQGQAQPQATPQPQSQQPPPQPAGQPAPSSGAAQPEYPWQSDQRWRDKGPEDIYNAYRGLEQKLGSHAQLEQFAQQINAFAQQYGGLERLAQLAQYGQQQWEQQSRQQQQPAQQQGNPYERWDLLTPQEQAQLLQQQVYAQFTPVAQQYAEAIRQQMQAENQQQLQAIQRQWDIFNRVLTKKIENPSLNVQEVLQQMVQTAQKGADPGQLMDWTLNNMTFDARVEQRANELAQARIADELQKQKNASLSSLTAVRPAPQGPGESHGPRNAAERKHHILQTLLAKGAIDASQV